MALSEIEKLERRYAENPQGLTFAPLAEVHRKSGDVNRALELLKPGLALHPDYIPASIVLGRCHLDLGDLASAEAAFTHVLGLDGENVIALKALADITERLVRLDESERWLRTLLAVDRSNDEAREQLARVELARQQADAGSSAAPDATVPHESRSAPGETQVHVAEGDVLDAEPESVDEPPPPSLYAPEPPPLPTPPPFGWLSDAAASESGEEPPPLDLETLDTTDIEAPVPDGIELEQPVILEAPVEPIAGLVGREAEPPLTDRVTIEEEFAVETAEDIVLESAGGSEFQVANASEELLVSRPPAPAGEPSTASLLEPELPPLSRESAESAAPASEPAPISAPEDRTGPEPTPLPETVAVSEPSPAAPAPWVPPIADPGRPVAPELMLTESMAELLLQQGHTAEALRVYRDLESRNAGDARLRDKIAELERSLRPEVPMPAPSAVDDSPVAGGATAPVTPAAYSVHATHGQGVGEFLRGMLAARLRPAPAGPAVHPDAGRGPATSDSEGAPTRPAQDSLSLSSVFGDESAPTQPAVPSSGTGGPSGGGVSYDEFFGGAGGGAPRPPRAPDAKNDDLDQFHTWLQNLKR